MRLPSAERAVVPQKKVGNYLLNLKHPVGGGKASFFLHFGFQPANWTLLADALRQHVLENEVADSVTDDDGETYLVEGPLETPSGRRPRIRSVWLVETGELAPRFITAYPLPQ